MKPRTLSRDAVTVTRNIRRRKCSYKARIDKYRAQLGNGKIIRIVVYTNLNKRYKIKE